MIAIYVAAVSRLAAWTMISYLLVVLMRDVDAVHLDDPVALPHPGGLRRAAGVHLADVLTRPRLLRVQVEAVAVEAGALGHGAVARTGRVVRDRAATGRHINRSASYES